MSLLSRIAISNGDKGRKAAAHRTLTAIDKHKVSTWNRRLQGDISLKRWLANERAGQSGRQVRVGGQAG